FRWRELRQLAPRRSMVEMYSVSRRSKQKRGLSTTFGWRLASLKMTDMWVVSACRACGGPLISAGGSYGNSRLGGPWWKCISVSREIQAAAGSFDYVRLAPHSAQDDRHVGCERVQGAEVAINFHWRE